MNSPTRHPTWRPRLAVGFGLALAIAASAVSSGTAAGGSAASMPTGLGRLLAGHNLSAKTRGIATFSGVPTAGTVAALKGLGLTVQPMHHVPLALLKGSVSAMKLAVTNGTARDVYPDDRIKLLDTESSDALGGAAVRAAGFTGKGVTVAVVDSGCDASHPDLADHVSHNVILVSAEYANARDNSTNTIVVPTETGPYQNSDLGSGHGTHVSGIIAADSTTDPKGGHFGVAPDAKLVCYSIGAVLFTTAVVTAYDHMLSQPDMWGIRVVNNSWGNSYRQFDPNDPVSVVTRAVVAHGAVVVFAAGNSGVAEMSLNPFSEAPWVISVAAGDVKHRLADFSSRGLTYDNSIAGYIGAGGHTAYSGDRIGVYHPDMTAPGVDISSSCDTAGTVVGPCQPGQNTTASGTSMASPHVAGAAAVLLQANPNLTPNQVRLALQATATPMKDANGKPYAFWQVGYGYVNLAKAVALVRGSGWQGRLATASGNADTRVLADGHRVTQSDFWTYDAPRATAGGTDSHAYSVNVPATVKSIKTTLSHPSLAAVGLNGTAYSVTVKDAAGRVIATGTESGLGDGAGTNSAFVDLTKVAGVMYGTFTVEVSGTYAASDPDTLDSDSALGRMVTLQVAQLTN